MKRFDELLLFIGANKKKELIKIIAINIVLISVTVIAVIFIKQIMFVMVGVIAIGIGNYLVFNSYLSKKAEMLNDRENELITIIGYFQFFISNSYNVYQTFKSIIPYSSAWMEEQIESLILEIDNDKSVKPYVNFANKFSNKMASNVMLSIYQMVDEGENAIHMLQFEALFSQLSINLSKQLIEQKERSMSSISTFPLIGAGAITVLITLGIISVMGEMISVI